MKKEPNKKHNHDSRFSNRIIIPEEIMKMYAELPSAHTVDRAKKRKEYVESLSEEDRKRYLEASRIAKAFQAKYTFKVAGEKCFPFTFNFRSKHWTVTWDKEWLDKAASVPALLNKIEHLIFELHQLAPRIKGKDGKYVVLTDANGKPDLDEQGNPLYKTDFDASATFDRK